MGDHMEMLNQASVDDLEKIEGIGRKRAEDIVSYREKNGGFRSWDDLKKIPGFNDELINAIKMGQEWSE